jgi:exopolysaccharide production protein ExoQ
LDTRAGKVRMLSTEQLEIAEPTQRVMRTVFTPLSVWQLALGWVLLIPMLYIAENGKFFPQAGDVDVAATGQTPGTPVWHKINLALFCLICLVLIVFRFPSVLALARRLKIVLAFPVLAILSCAWSADPRQSMVSGLILLIFTMFAIYVASRFSFQRQLELVMLVGMVALPTSIALALLVPTVGTTEAGWRGIFGHKQMCAAVSTLWLITALHWKSSGMYHKTLRAVCVVMSGVLIVMSQSRTGWALALVALLLSGAISLLQKMPAKQGLLLLLFGVPLAVIAAYGLHAHSSIVLAAVGKDSTLTERTTIWAAVWDAALRHPILGYGFAAFWKGLYGPSQNIVLVVGWGLEQAQDGFLDIWLQIGAVGIVLLVSIIGRAMRNALHGFYSEGNERYVRWCIVIILSTLIYNIGESSVGLLNMTWFLFLLACIGLEQAANQRELKLRSTESTSTSLPFLQQLVRARR